LFFIASEVKATFFGAIGAKKDPARIARALHRILGKVTPQHFNDIEVTGIAAKPVSGAEMGS
jgi:hypothetical protein